MRTEDAVKFLQELQKSGVVGDRLFQKFQTAARDDRKLACALRGFLLGEDRDVYLRYLLARLRQSVSVLILSGNTAALKALDAYAVFTEALTDEFLKTAIDCGGQETAVWLLMLKAARFGFRDKDFSL